MLKYDRILETECQTILVKLALDNDKQEYDRRLSKYRENQQKQKQNKR